MLKFGTEEITVPQREILCGLSPGSFSTGEGHACGRSVILSVDRAHGAHALTRSSPKSWFCARCLGRSGVSPGKHRAESEGHACKMTCHGSADEKCDRPLPDLQSTCAQSSPPGFSEVCDDLKTTGEVVSRLAARLSWRGRPVATKQLVGRAIRSAIRRVGC